MVVEERGGVHGDLLLLVKLDASSATIILPSSFFCLCLRCLSLDLSQSLSLYSSLSLSLSISVSVYLCLSVCLSVSVSLCRSLSLSLSLSGWYLRQKPVGGSKAGGLLTLPFPFPSPPPFHSPYVFRQTSGREGQIQ